MHLLSKFSDGINKVSEGFLCLSIVAMTVIITIQIIFRVFFDALSWTEELTRYLLVWSSFLGASIGIKRGSHIAVTVLTDSLQGNKAKVVKLITLILTALFFIITGYFGINLIEMQVFQVSPALGLPMKHVYLIIPLSMSVMLIHTLLEMFLVIKGAD